MNLIGFYKVNERFFQKLNSLDKDQQTKIIMNFRISNIYYVNSKRTTLFGNGFQQFLASLKYCQQALCLFGTMLKGKFQIENQAQFLK